MTDTVNDDAPPAALFRFFEAMPRQGPGDDAITRALYRRIRPLLPDHPETADMGCGSGAAGLVLAGEGAAVTGIDIHQPFLDAFRSRAAAAGLEVQTRRAGMTQSGLPSGRLDLIWSEGAVYQVGFDAALDAFWNLLRPGGVVCLSECCWLRDDPPDELRRFWAEGYPDMRDAANNIAAAESSGYETLHHEVLPAQAWETGFYQPMERLIAGIDRQSDPDLYAIGQEQRQEIALFRRYHGHFGYVFFQFRKPDHDI